MRLQFSLFTKLAFLLKKYNSSKHESINLLSHIFLLFNPYHRFFEIKWAMYPDWTLLQKVIRARAIIEKSIWLNFKLVNYYLFYLSGTNIRNIYTYKKCNIYFCTKPFLIFPNGDHFQRTSSLGDKKKQVNSSGSKVIFQNF